jgi:predicted MPP superfamily phosphohydrolase
MQSRPRIPLALLAVFLCISLFSGVSAAAGNSTTYSFVHLSDTQNLATSYPATYNTTFSYLESVKSTRNISAIIITGDLVNTWNSKKEWDAYLRARNQTTIPVFVTAGNHDTDSGKKYEYYSRYTGNSGKNYLTSFGDFDLVGINYVKAGLTAAEYSRIRLVLENSIRPVAIIATHYYMDKNGKSSPLGREIDKNLIVKPTLILTGHLHADFINRRNISGFPVIGEMTNYQNGLPGGNGDKNYSAGTLYTVTSSGGQVERITARVIHIRPGPSLDAEQTVFEQAIPSSSSLAEPPAPVVLPARPVLPTPFCNPAVLSCRLNMTPGQGIIKTN